LYTNGTNGLTAINATANYLPVVAYDSANVHLYVGWTYDNSNNNYGAGYHPGVILPVVVQCTSNGIPVPTTYWDAPRTITGNANKFSIANRHSSDFACSWFDNVNGSRRIYYKSVLGPTSGLKISNLQSPSEEINPDELFIQLYDLNGRLIMNSTDSNIFEKLNSASLNPGIYIIRNKTLMGTKC
jgi:hypothetical protein